MKPVLGITMGDVNGVGPEIVAKAFARADAWAVCTPVVLGSLAVYDVARRSVPASPNGVHVSAISDAVQAPRNTLGFFECDAVAPAYRPGTLDPAAGTCAMQWLERAVDLTMRGELDGIVTAPINKEGIHAAGYEVSGHTDFIARMIGTDAYRMALFSDTLRIVHVSGHVALKDAIDAVAKDRIIETIGLADEILGRLGLTRRIAVAGLNPHAGEAGAFGKEEQTEIAPAVAWCRAQGIDCSGPHSPDAVFRRALDGEFDLVIAMYHDQGHIPLKLVAMDDGVNVTLGLPIVRTSVDHGTAYDIAGRDLAREDSLVAAINLAARLARSHRGVAS